MSDDGGDTVGNGRNEAQMSTKLTTLLVMYESMTYNTTTKPNPMKN